jgi:hypothetical protein
MPTLPTSSFEGNALPVEVPPVSREHASGAYVTIAAPTVDRKSVRPRIATPQ